MTRHKAHILVIDDNTEVLHTARMVLKPLFTQITTESNPQQINYLIRHHQYHVILLDMNYTTGATSGKEGLFWLKQILEIRPDQQVVMMTAYGDLKLAVEAMKVGAADFIVKPWENEKFQATMLSAFNHSQSKKELSDLRQKQSKVNEILSEPGHQIIGNSLAMQEVFNTIDKVAKTDAHVLILGENGTGKELVAKAIHQKSMRASEIFVKVDLGALSESLFESELFGHKKGAFTDAKEDRTGRFVLADQGTLFLDEIGNLSLPMQAKMLTAIQNKAVTPVGIDHPIKTDCRIISATNENLPELVAHKNFREDLLYRINTVEIVIPPLRNREEDIALLSQHFLSVFNHKYRKELELTHEAIAYLNEYAWPGNVRELEHAVERAVIMADDVKLTPTDFLLGTRHKQPSKSRDTYNIDEIEKQTIEDAIDKFQGNMTKVAQALGLGRTTLYRKLEKYGIR